MRKWYKGDTHLHTTNSDGNMLIIQGQELTDEPGHVNVWGAKVPHDPPHKLDGVKHNFLENYNK